MTSVTEGGERIARTRRARRTVEREGPDTSGWDITQFLTFRIDVMHRFQIRQTKRMLAAGFNLTLAEWRVLNNLARRSPDTVGAIAARTAIAKSQISRAAASLAWRGFVLRTDNPADARTPDFSLTESGRRLYEDVMEVGRDRQRRLLAQLDPAQRKAMFDAIDVLTAYMRANA